MLDIVTWLMAGIIIGTKLYPKKRVRDPYEKLPFIMMAVTITIMAGLFAATSRGLPEAGLGFYNLIFAVLVTIFALGIFFPDFRRKLVSQVHAFFKGKESKTQLPPVIRYS